MKQLDNRRIDMLANGPIGSTLFKLSAPAVAGMVVMAIYNMADTFFVSLLRDTTAVAATGIVFPLFQMIGAVGLTFGMGAASVISRRLGENNYTQANRTAATALYSALGVGLLFSFLGAVFVEPILRLFGATDTILQAATLYGRIIIGGSVFQIMNMTLNNILRAEGASLHSSTGQILGAVLNIALDPVFIFVFNMGISGAAVATVISQCISTLYLSYFYLRRKGSLDPLNWTYVHLTAFTYRDIMILGFPTFVRQILGSIAFGIVNNAAGTYGDSAIAAISVTLRLFLVLLMGLMGMAQGLQPLAGYNYGARQFKRVRKTFSLVFTITAIICAGAGIGTFILAGPIMRIFTPQDPEVIFMGITAIRYWSVALVPVGLVLMFGGIFQALGDGRSALILAAGQQGVFLIPLILILPRFIGMNGVFVAQPAAFVLAFVVGLLLFRKQLALLKSMEETALSAPSEW